MTDEILIELVKALVEDNRQMRTDIARLARGSYLQDLKDVANTPARQEIWRLCDGSRSNEEIARQIGITLRAVQYFVQDAEKKGLIITKKRGYPKRSESFDEEDPLGWKPYKKPETPAVPEPEIGGNSNEQ